MDYDDNDFRSQNFQLVGEDNNKFPPNSRSFALPKFDLDEHLQLHLRFDSLVDTDSLLDIHGQESNWIEDFSAGSAIEFSSSAADSCPISRHNNVWSEATSSESVEMLLKSVGEDEMLDKKATLTEAGSQEGLNGINNQIDPCSVQENSILEKGGVVMTDPLLPPDKCRDSYLGLDVDDMGGQPQAVDVSQTSTEKSLEMHFDTSLVDKLNDDPGTSTEGCTVHGSLASSSEDMTKQGLAVKQSLNETLLSENVSDGVSRKVSTHDDHDLVESKVAGGSTDCKTCCTQDHPSDPDVVAEKTSHEMFSEKVTEQYSGIAFSGKLEVQLSIDAQKEKAQIDSEVNDQCSEDGPPNVDPRNEIKSLCVESKTDPQVCKNSTFSEDPDGLLEAIPYQVKVTSKICERDDKLAMQIEEGTSLAVKCDDKFDGVSTERGSETEDPARRSHLTGGFKEAGHGEVVSLPKDDCSQIPNILSDEKSKMVNDHELGRRFNTLRKETAEMQVPTENPYSHVDSASRSAGKACSSIHAHAETAVSKINNDDCIDHDPSNFTSLTHESSYLEKSTEGELGEKSDFVVNPSEVVREQSPSVVHSDVDLKISSSGCKSFDPSEAKRSVGRPCSASVIPDVDSIQGISIQPVTSDTRHTNDNASFALEEKADASSVCQNTDVVPPVDEPADKMIQSESDPKNVDYSSVPDSVHFNKTESKALVLNPINVGDSSSKTVIQDESFASHAGIAELTSQESGTDRLHFEKTIVADVIIGQEEPTSPPCIPNTTQTSEEKVKTSETSSLPVSESAGQDERKAIPLPPSESSMDICQDDAQTCLKDKSHQPLTLSGNDTNIPMEAGGSSPSSLQPNGSSPAVMSCSEQPLGETECREDSREFLDKGGSLPSKIRADVDNVGSTARDSKDSTTFENDKSFTFEVGSLAKLSKGDTASEGKSFCNIQSVEIAQVSSEKSPGGHTEYKEGKHHDNIVKKTKGKTTPMSGCSTGRVHASKRKSAKEASLQKHRDGNLCSNSPSTLGSISRDIHFEQMRQFPFENSSNTPRNPVVPVSSLPDLNASISAAALFHQPFTDLQQVQLRAQIFVYGSLIQGSPPEETCMISAFGETDGGRNVWNAVWRAAVERFQNQKSCPSTCETPINSHSGIWVPEHVTRCGSVQSNALSPLSTRSGTKVTSAALSSTMPLPSPLWNLSPHDGLQSNVARGTHLDFSQVFSPVYTYQSSQARPYTGDGTPSISTAHSVPMVLPIQNPAADAVAQYSTIPTTEPVHVTPAKDSSVFCSPSMQLVSPSVLLPASGSSSFSAASVGKMEVIKKAVSPGNMKNASTAPKSRKKKVAVSESGPILPASHPQGDSSSVIGATKHLPVSSSMPLPSNSPARVLSCGLPSATPHIVSPTHYQIIGSGGVEQRAVFSEETCSRIEQAKLHAEDAAALAASSVKHSQGIWSHLAAKKNSGLVSEVEEKLASAAVAAAAAASVAKAAAAAAKVASDAALQAKMMADEAMNSARGGNTSNSSYATFLDVGKNMATLTPTSTKDNVQGSSSILSAAREAAKRRVEAASAATKRAENLDAIVKAAALAAEAVSQAGIIIGMGDPLPFSLNELVEYGPESYWKIHQSAVERHPKASSKHREEQLGLEGLEDHASSAKQFREQPSSCQEYQNSGEKVRNDELPLQSVENYAGNELRKLSTTVPNVRHDEDHLAKNLVGNIIQNGSLVEVVSDKDSLRGVWFSAYVLDVKDGKAYVCYNNLRDEGSGQLKEWISLEAEGNEAPRIRNAHPVTVANSGGTRKRRRDVVSNYTWAVGDHVDAWIRDGWWEGIITEKNKDDETKLTVHFPVGGDSLALRSWNLRPSLIWKDGQWREWLRPRENYLHEGDTPLEKRQRLGRSEEIIGSEVDERGTNEPSDVLLSEASRKLEESRPLLLAAKDKIFSVGKTGRENNVDSLKVKRTGLQKEGSKVIFGIPRPGKKRKFMEVSKHYVADKTDKTSEGNDSIKFAKYLMPQTSRMWRNTPKVDPKGKGAVDSRPKGLKSATSQSIQIRSIADKVNSSIPSLSASNGGESGHVPLPSVKTSKNGESIVEKKDLVEAGSLSNSIGTADDVVVKSSVHPLTGIPSLKKSSSLAVGGELGVKRRHVPSMEKSSRSEDKGFENPGKTIPDVIEPRRSNRRIQPTSRLLEGLQSSLLISKIPSVSHDKGAKVMHRGGSSSRGKTHG